KDNCVECKEIISEIETLEYLVYNLEEELEILIALDGINELETEWRTQVEDLIKANEKIFAEGLTQLGRTKKEMYKIILKEEAKPIKQKLYRVSHTKNEFIVKKVEQIVKYRIIHESTSS
ncbi:34515_t:CDS:1, partial [Gigaspora margarita]